MLLPKPQRKHVHAIYALCRLADDIVDLPDTTEPAAIEAQLDRVRGVASGPPWSTGAATTRRMAAIVHTVITCGIEPECFERFFGAMRMDLTVTSYHTWLDLCGYMEGSAAVIGEMMLPVLEPTSPKATAPARSLGLAFQLTNFLRDVGEDLDRGRVYLPQEDLERFGVDLTLRRATPEWKAFLAYEIERNRALYAFADTGIAPAAAALGPLRRHGPGALRADPGPDRGGGLRRVLDPGPGAHLAQGGHRGPHPRRRPAEAAPAQIDRSRSHVTSPSG